jgi:hypothetical protein
MTTITKPCMCAECCEFNSARDEDLACAQMFDYAIELRDRARKDWEHSTARFKAAVVARNQQHPADTQAARA